MRSWTIQKFLAPEPWPLHHFAPCHWSRPLDPRHRSASCHWSALLSKAWAELTSKDFGGSVFLCRCTMSVLYINNNVNIVSYSISIVSSMTLHLHNMMCIYACVCIYNIWHMLYTAFWTGLDRRFLCVEFQNIAPKVSSSLWRHENYPPSVSWRALERSTARSASKFPTKIVWVTITATSKAFAGTLQTLQVLRLKKLAASWHCPIIVKCQSESRLVWRSVCHETHVKESNSSTNHHASFVPFATKMPLSTRTFGSERTCGIEVVQSQRQAASFSSYKVSGVNIVQAFVVIRPQT